MTKTEEIKKKIKELTETHNKLEDKVMSISQEVRNLKDELDREENKAFYEGVRKLRGKYIKYEASSDKYHNIWYIYVNGVDEEGDAIRIVGKSICLVFVDNNGARSQLIAYTYDIESNCAIEKDWEDAYAGYFKFNNIMLSTEVEFGLAKDMIKELN